MANIQSAKKRAKQNARRNLRNRVQMNRLRTFLRYNAQAIASGDLVKAQETLRQATGELHRAAQKGLLHKSTASRKISRLTKQVSALAG